MTSVVLEAENLVKIYGRGDTRFAALRGVDLRIRHGESVAVVGKSGSGKSTLMHLLALLDAPTHGSVLLEGRPAASMTARELNETRNAAFGFVFQQFYLTPDQTVLENVVLPLRIAGVRPGARRRRALDVLERLEVAEKASSRAVDLSGGQKQRVAIARALVNDPSVIFADEPTGNLDSATGAVVQDLLFDLHREQGITLVVVTHDEDLALRCGRQVHLHDGLVVDAPALAPVLGAGPGGEGADAVGAEAVVGAAGGAR
ncbi:ABC transporter ATP-binding protein [Kocuria sp. M4R2S49]|uniref:ABC transporter ATP-binding protein n=1 Tax=Kocuria rhizosphaericola TaxID=3376284 RepID=UPI0037889B73